MLVVADAGEATHARAVVEVVGAEEIGLNVGDALDATDGAVEEAGGEAMPASAGENGEDCCHENPLVCLTTCPVGHTLVEMLTEGDAGERTPYRAYLRCIQAGPALDLVCVDIRVWHDL